MFPTEWESEAFYTLILTVSKIHAQFFFSIRKAQRVIKNNCKFRAAFMQLHPLQAIG